MQNLLFTLVLTRILYASLSIIPCFAIFFLVDQFRVGETVEYLAILVGLCLSWAAVEGLSRHSLRSFGVVSVISTFIAIAVWQLLAGPNMSALIPASAGCAVGLSINCFLRERRSILAFLVLMACITPIALFYYGFQRWNAPKILHFIAAGVLLHGVAGLVLAGGYWMLSIHPACIVQYSLRSLLLFYILLGLESTVLYNFRSPQTPGVKERERFTALSTKASNSLARRQPGDALNSAVEEAAAFGGKWQLSVSELEAVLGPANVDTLQHTATWTFDGKDDVRAQIFEARLGPANSRILQMKASGPVLFITDPGWRQRQDNLLLFLLFSCAGLNLVFVRWMNTGLKV